MRTTSLIFVPCLLVAGGVAASGGSSLLPPKGGSPSAVAAAVRRNRQLPLREAHALVAAYSARAFGDQAAEIELLERASSGGELAEVARIELATRLVTANGDRAMALALPTLERPGTPQLLDAALEIILEVLSDGIERTTRDRLERTVSRLPRNRRRRLQAGLADPLEAAGRKALFRLLQRDRVDLAGLEAARRLDALPDLTAGERWLVGRNYYRHALYEEAIEKFDALAGARSPGVPMWEVHFLRGRCAFRKDNWARAADQYRRALPLAPDRERAAELRVHLARALELGGDLAAAVEQARLAVVADTTDSRRLFLARLRLSSGRPDLAEAGITRIRPAGDRSRGRLLVALNALAQGRTEEGLAALDRVSARPWRGPARVLAARLHLRGGRHTAALESLRRAAQELDAFWGRLARTVMAELPTEVVERWRELLYADIRGEESARRRALREWSVLEVDSQEMKKVRSIVDLARTKTADRSEPEGLAGLLWGLGLGEAAVRWDPESFPLDTAENALWTALVFSAEKAPWRAIRAADRAWRVWGADLPLRAYGEDLQEASFPQPYRAQVRDAAHQAAIDWAVVAGVAREESRWDSKVLSRVGARGLMQLMPATAFDVAARLDLEAPSPEALFDPGLSLLLGSHELGRLVAAFDGFVAPAIAAYNAGEAQSRQWLEYCGAGCDEGRFLLTVTFDATRTYTADVLTAASFSAGRVNEQSGQSRGVPANSPPSARSPD